jgi:hypothetical protein
MERIYQEFDRQGNEDNQEAYAVLIDSGMTLVTPDQGQIPEWRKVIRESNYRLANQGALDVRLLNELECYLDAFRAGNLAKTCTQ